MREFEVPEVIKEVVRTKWTDPVLREIDQICAQHNAELMYTDVSEPNAKDIVNMFDCRAMPCKQLCGATRNRSDQGVGHKSVDRRVRRVRSEAAEEAIELFNCRWSDTIVLCCANVFEGNGRSN
jgi:hypothetical protein